MKLAFWICSLFLVYKCSNNLLTSIVYDTQNYIKSFEAFVNAKEERTQNIANSIVEFEKGKNGVYVVVIGESQLRDNMSAYGYDRKTTPWLETFKEDDNNIIFSNAYSCHAYTTVSLAYALTAKNQYNNLDEKYAASLIEVANAAGYDTVWLSNQTRYSLADNPVTVIASSAEQQVWTNTSTDTCYTVFYDGKLIEHFKNIKLSDRMLIVVHLMGNHVGYTERYPDEFNVFSEKNNIDRYDNSILYNDFVMKKLFNTISKIPNFKAMLYFADHGEDVRNGLRHDVNRFTFDMTRVPMYLHFSKSYLEENKTKCDNVNKWKDSIVTNDLVFNMIMSIMDIKIPNVYESENDIMSENYNDNIARFKTLYGTRLIVEDEMLKK